MNIKLTPAVKIFLICAACVAINTTIRDSYRRMGEVVIFTSSLGFCLFAAMLVMNLEDFARNDFSLLYSSMPKIKFGDEEEYSSYGSKISKVSSYKKK